MRTALTILLTWIASVSAHASPLPDHLAPPNSQSNKCTSRPCGNTATGEDPQEVAEREGAKILDTIRKSKSDTERWKLRLYSSSTKPEQLEIVLIDATNFKMRLLPKKGYVQFDSAQTDDTFEIADPEGYKSTACPTYTVSIVDASAKHATLRKSCQLFEYRPNRFSMSSTYYLYDIDTHSMRIIWEAVATGKDSSFPNPDSAPKITLTQTGYNIDWEATYPVENGREKLTLSNRYVKAVDSNHNRKALVCTDMLAPSGEGVETGSCERGRLKLISSVSRR